MLLEEWGKDDDQTSFTTFHIASWSNLFIGGPPVQRGSHPYARVECASAKSRSFTRSDRIQATNSMVRINDSDSCQCYPRFIPTISPDSAEQPRTPSSYPVNSARDGA